MKTTLPEIFTLISCPMLGQLGPDTEIVENEPCEQCGQEYRPLIAFLDYQFDTWERAELIKAADVYAITRRLFEAFQSAGLKGCSTRRMKTSRGEIMDEIDPERKIVIPEFLQLWIDGETDGPSGWWERGPVCPECHRIIWKSTDRVVDALFAKYSNEPGPPRLVWSRTWDGSDVFMMSDPGPPLVTDRFKKFAEQEKVEGLVLAPAKWVDD
jgi:hypothetical protein